MGSIWSKESFEETKASPTSLLNLLDPKTAGNTQKNREHPKPSENTNMRWRGHQVAHGPIEGNGIL